MSNEATAEEMKAEGYHRWGMSDIDGLWVRSPQRYLLRKGWGAEQGGFVSVRPCGKEFGDETYLGIYLGDMPTGLVTERSGSDLRLKLANYNPAIWVPDLTRIVFGNESWWGAIETPADLKAITNKDIDNIWYVKALQQMAESEDASETADASKHTSGTTQKAETGGVRDD